MDEEREVHEHEWVPLGNMEVCRGCPAFRATTPEAEEVLRKYGDTKRLPMKRADP